MDSPVDSSSLHDDSPSNPNKIEQASTLFCAVGDVYVNRSEPDDAFEHVRASLAAADIRFGNCEAVYANDHDRYLAAVAVLQADPRNFEAVRAVAFDVMSFANNHALDCGYGGFFETLRLLHGAGIQTVGAGADLSEAQKPAIVVRNGIKVGVLAYTCHLPPGFDAREAKAGCASIRILTAYRDRGHFPGSPPEVHTYADRDDLASIEAAIRLTRPQVDVLIATYHWGIPMVRAQVSDYERELAQASIDAGADMVLGHGQHIIKGVGFYRQKPIFYGLGNFVFDLDYQFPIGCEMSMLAQLHLCRRGVKEVELRPVVINAAGQPVPLVGGSGEFVAFLRYLEDITAEAGLNANFTPRDLTIAVS
jgi:poly-gamma-glutamate capsule biosynthesis protein CapA/YwtB (metallophosphatase superfamily)